MTVLLWLARDGESQVSASGRVESRNLKLRSSNGFDTCKRKKTRCGAPPTTQNRQSAVWVLILHHFFFLRARPWWHVTSHQGITHVIYVERKIKS
jgi:hypothetical protein